MGNSIILGGRRSGRTLAMVKALPDDGCTIVIPTHQFRGYLRDMIYAVRGKAVLDKVNMVIVEHMADIERLRGTGRPIRIDHAWLEHAEDRRTQSSVVEALMLLKDHEERRAKA